jgi:hypothetical protein
VAQNKISTDLKKSGLKEVWKPSERAEARRIGFESNTSTLDPLDNRENAMDLPIFPNPITPTRFPRRISP